MADNFITNTATGGVTFASDEITGTPNVHWPFVKIAWGALNATNIVDTNASNALPVQVLAVTPGVGATDLGKDIAGVSDATGTGVLGVAIRRDADTAFTGVADNDYAPLLVNATGALKVEIFDGGDTHTVANAALSITGGGVEAGALRVTLANDSTGVLSIDDNGATLSIDDGGATISVDGTVSVDTITTSIVPGTAATNLGKAVGAIADAAPTGVGAIAIRRDANTVFPGVADNDYAPLLVDANGYLKVEMFDGGDTITVDNGGTFAVQVDGAALTSLQAIDDIVHAGQDAAYVASVPISGQLDETATQAVTENQVAPVRITAGRALHVAQQGTATVSGTVTADAGTGPWPITDNGGAITVDWAGTAPPIGAGTEAAALRVTVATDSTGVVSVDDNAASLTVDAPVGTPVNVQIGDGTNQASIRNLAANDSLNVAIVDGAGDQITTFGGGSQATEDAAAATNPVGTHTVMVRQDTPATLVSADGDVVAQRATNYGAAYAQIVTSAGAFVDTFGGGTQVTEDAAAVANPIGTQTMMVRQDTPAALVTADGDHVAQRATNFGAGFVQVLDSSGNFIDTFGGSGGTAAADGAVYVAGTTQGTPAMGAFDDTTPGSLGEDDVGIMRMSANRNLYTTLRDAAGNERGVNVNASNQLSISVDNTPTVTANAGTNLNTSALALESGGNLATLAGAVAGTEMQVDIVAVTPDLMLGTDFSDVLGTASLTTTTQADALANTTDTVNVTGFNMVFNGTTWDRLREGGEAGSVLVDLGANNDVTVSGTVTADLGANNDIQGQAAHDAAVTGNPVLISARANANEPAAVNADNDAVHLWADRLGRLVTVNGHPSPEAPTSVVATAADTTIIAAPGAGVANVVQRMSIHNAGAAAATVTLEDGLNGTVRWQAELAADGGGSLVDFGEVGWRQTDNTLLNLTQTPTGTIHVNVTSWFILD